MISLEQFNEEVMKEFKEDYTMTKNHKFLGTREPVTIPIWNASPSDIQAFITQKLTEHKELILKMVRRKAPHSYDEDELTNYADGWNNCREEFLNNLDTI